MARGNKQLKRLAAAVQQRKKKRIKKPRNNDQLFAEYDAIDKARAAEVDEMTIRQLTGRELSKQVPPKSVRFQAAQGQTRKDGGHRS